MKKRAPSAAVPAPLPEVRLTFEGEAKRAKPKAPKLPIKRGRVVVELPREAYSLGKAPRSFDLVQCVTIDVAITNGGNHDVEHITRKILAALGSGS